ncbi:hypothetical protein SDC9_165276 [bioreactor metagenome]|uniref:Uncharacterized protein n=1 Tax=bioreactor metagenome TaxID=1076179 RepID=A0A645FWG6_9ZZZZ
MALILTGFALIALIDLIPLIRQHTKSGIAAFSIIFMTALTLTILQTNKVEVPSVLILLGDALKAWGISY